MLGVLQVTALVLRPQPNTKYRPLWAFLHVWFGRSAIAIAIANIYYGCIHVEALGTWAWASYTGVLGAIILVAITNDVVQCSLGRRLAGERDKSAGQFLSGSAANGAQPAPRTLYASADTSANSSAVFLIDPPLHAPV